MKFHESSQRMLLSEEATCPVPGGKNHLRSHSQEEKEVPGPQPRLSCSGLQLLFIHLLVVIARWVFSS